MMAKTQLTIIFLSCLMKVAEVQAHCARPDFGGNRVLTAESEKPAYVGGDTVHFQCVPGYEPTWLPASTSITCNGRQWSKLQLQCRKKSCGRLVDISNGRYSYKNGTMFGATTTAECEAGYKLVGENVRTCQAEGWDGKHPVCEVVKCSPKTNNGHRDEAQQEENEYAAISDDTTVQYRSCVSFAFTESGGSVTLSPGVKGQPESILWKIKPNKVVEYAEGSARWYRFKSQGLLDEATGDLTLQRLKSNNGGVYECEILLNGVLMVSKYELKVMGGTVDGKAEDPEPVPNGDSDAPDADDHAHDADGHAPHDGRVFYEAVLQTQRDIKAAIEKQKNEMKDIKVIMSDISVTLKELLKKLGQA